MEVDQELLYYGVKDVLTRQRLSEGEYWHDLIYNKYVQYKKDDPFAEIRFEPHGNRPGHLEGRLKQKFTFDYCA